MPSPTSVSNFVVGCRGVGEIRFLKPVDLTEILARDRAARSAHPSSSNTSSGGGGSSSSDAPIFLEDSVLFTKWIRFSPQNIEVFPDQVFAAPGDLPRDKQGDSQKSCSLSILVKPPVGSDLNQPARISLERCWPLRRGNRTPVTDPTDPLMRQHIEKLRGLSGTRFIDFSVEDGTWTFEVAHF